MREGSRTTLLRKNAGFRRFFLADTVSQFGSQVSAVALPLVALVTLNATSLELGVLTAAGTAAFAVAALPAGVLVDRCRRQPVLITTDLCRTALLASVPVAALLGVLTLWQLYAVALVSGVATVVHSVAQMSYLPTLVGRDALVSANTTLHTAGEASYSAGPAAGGLLAQLFGPVWTVSVDAASFLYSAIVLRGIQTTEPRPEPSADKAVGPQVREGLRYVLNDPALRMLATSGLALCVATSMLVTIQPVLLVRDLGVSASLYGLILGVDAVGGVLGGIAAGAATRRLGLGRSIWIPSVVVIPFVALIPFTGEGWALLCYPAGTFAYSLSASIRNVAQMSFRQATCPPELLGRMNATMRFLTWGGMPLGGLLGGALASAFGTRSAAWVAVALIAISTVPVLTKPIRLLIDPQ